MEGGRALSKDGEEERLHRTKGNHLSQMGEGVCLHVCDEVEIGVHPLVQEELQWAVRMDSMHVMIM